MEGYETLAALAKDRPLLHIAANRRAMRRLASVLGFLAPGLDILTLPAWDCLPYDRASPGADIVAGRIETLVRLTNDGGPAVVLTTIDAALQRLPPRRAFAANVFRAAAGDIIAPDQLKSWLLRNGYAPAATVREPGDFAFRDDLLDLYPPGAAHGLRVDLVNGMIEHIRPFDPDSQRGDDRRLDRLSLHPMSEVLLDAAAIARFDQRYRDLFGSPADNDGLHRAIAAGRRHQGMEHWLPLFFDGTETLFDYLPDAAVTLDDGILDQRDERLAQIRDAYEARKTMRSLEARANLPVYKPLPPDALYLTAPEWDALLAARETHILPAPQRLSIALDELGERLEKWRARKKTVLIAVERPGQRRALAARLKRNGIDTVLADSRDEAAAGAPVMVLMDLDEGFETGSLAVLTRAGLIGDGNQRGTPKRLRLSAEIAGLAQGDLVVHADHGIGLCDGIETIATSGFPHDCLRLFYDGGDKLFVPVENLDMLWRFGATGDKVKLDKLGGVGWQHRIVKAKARIRDMAAQLVKIAAARRMVTPQPLPPPPAYGRFADRFPYSETPGQQRAIDDVLADLRSGHPMDRLVCGDAGFGKTEVALRAAFIVAMQGRQVALIAPTTPLCRQHCETFHDRFAGFGVSIAQLSRAIKPSRIRGIKEDLRSGETRIVIGTHALLARNVDFADLGLLIIDEEQRLGVKQKERLKSLADKVHVLTMTATPIPRTMQLALAGLRDLSVIDTPPVERRPVRSFAGPLDPITIREALKREQARGGQSFAVCPRIEDLPAMRDLLAELLPDAAILTAHGQMPAAEMDDAISAFADGDGDILLATNIIENGLNIPNANSLVVHHADLFGLAQLYQLRGRVGRGGVQAYAYLTYEGELTEDARQRLDILTSLQSQSAGFTLANRDMDLRGGGNLLGEEQSGHIKEVGAELFQHLLRQAVDAVRRGQPEPEAWAPQIHLGTAVQIPETYIPDAALRLAFYRHIATLAPDEAEDFAAELTDRFGPLPPEIEPLLALGELKRLCRDARVQELDVGPKGAVLLFRPGAEPPPGLLRPRPMGKWVCQADWPDTAARLAGLRDLLHSLTRHRAAAE